MDFYLKSNALAHRLYSLDQTEENYYCNFSINPAFKNDLQLSLVCVSGVDQDNKTVSLNDQITSTF